jgi:hypothetical protein
MPSRRKKSKAMPFNPSDVAGIATANPYIQRLIEDAKLRENVRKVVESSRSAYGRVSNGKVSARGLLEDTKLQGDVAEALEALRDATLALTEAPKRQARKGRRIFRRLMILGLAFALALVASEKLRSKVLDTLFGAEEEFEYTPPPSTATTPPAAPVSAA